jgi:cytochrome c
MIRTTSTLLATASLALLAACGQTSQDSSAASSPPAVTQSAAPAPTPAEAAARVAALPAPYAAGDSEHGHIVFARCQICHSAIPGGADMIGPNLSGVIGRKAGAKPGFSYSDGLKAAGFVWTPQRLDTWLTNPRAMIPGTKMSFAGLSDAKDRADVIAYLATQAPAK